MHKTVKLGDASLQYTIVPQSEETIVDEINGKCYSNDSEESFCGSAAKKNRTHRAARSPSNYKPFRCRGAVVFILVTLALGCGIVIAAVLVPILVASKLTGYVPETVKFQTFAIAASSVFENSQSDQRQSRHRYIHLLPVKQVPSFDFSPNSRQHSVTAANNVTASNAANGEHSGERVTVAEQADHQNARSGDTTSVPSSGDSSAKVSSAVTDTGATHRVSMFTQYRQSRYQISRRPLTENFIYSTVYIERNLLRGFPVEERGNHGQMSQRRKLGKDVFHSDYIKRNKDAWNGEKKLTSILGIGTSTHLAQRRTSL